MTVLSGGGERNETGGRRGRILIEKRVGLHSVRVLKRRGHCGGVVEGAGRAWEERGCAGLTGCGCAGPGSRRGGGARTRRPVAWRLFGGWCTAGFGRK